MWICGLRAVTRSQAADRQARRAAHKLHKRYAVAHSPFGDFLNRGEESSCSVSGECVWLRRLHVVDRLVAVLRIWQSAHVGVDARVRSTVRPMENAGRASWRQLSGMRTVGKNKFTSGEKVLDEIPRVPRLATAMRRLIHRWRR
jgi:hypothetical protein